MWEKDLLVIRRLMKSEAQSLQSETAMRSRSKYVQKEFQRRVCKADGKEKRNDNRTGRESECGKKYIV